MSSIISYLASNVLPLLLGVGGVALAIFGIRSGIKSNSAHKKTQKVEAEAASSREATSQKVAEVQTQKEKDLSSVSKDGKERVKALNGKIKDFNSKI